MRLLDGREVATLESSYEQRALIGYQILSEVLFSF